MTLSVVCEQFYALRIMQGTFEFKVWKSHPFCDVFVFAVKRQYDSVHVRFIKNELTIKVEMPLFLRVLLVKI